MRESYSTPRPDPSPTTTALAGLLPLAYYVATASGHGYWLDAGELIAAGRELGISHPPGHPLSGLLGGAASLLPVGPLAFRVALASALCAAGALALYYRALFRTLTIFGAVHASLLAPLALSGTWIVAGAGGFVLQAVRPEVYALQALLCCAVLDALVTFERDYPDADPRRLYAAAFVHGLALANHHLMALLLLPAVAPSLARLYVARRARALWRVAAAAAAGLSTYLYLPFRAAARPTLNLGQPDSPARLFWVVSAKAFQKNTGSGVPQPLGERFLDVLAATFDALTPWLAVASLGGLYLGLRLTSSRRVTVLWALVAGAAVVARAWLGFVRSNPDALGYLVPAWLALTALAVCLIGALAAIPFRRRASSSALVAGLTATVVALSMLRLHEGVARASLARFDATDILDDARRRDLPARAVVLAHSPSTVFRHYGARVEEWVRPDVTLVPLPLLTYPGMVASLVDRAPELRQLLRGYLLHGTLRQPDLQSLASQRPLFLEMDVRVPPELYDTLVPDGLLYRVLPGGATDSDERLAAREQLALFEALYDRLGEQVREPRTREVLLWQHYTDALYYAGYGDRASAQAAVAYGLALQPVSRELLALRDALSDPQRKGPLDVRPFMPLE